MRRNSDARSKRGKGEARWAPLSAFACWAACVRPVYFFFAAFFATFLAAFFVAILPVLPVIKRVCCDAFIAANEGIDFRQKSVKKNRRQGAFILVHFPQVLLSLNRSLQR